MDGESFESKRIYHANNIEEVQGIGKVWKKENPGDFDFWSSFSVEELSSRETESGLLEITLKDDAAHRDERRES